MSGVGAMPDAKANRCHLTNNGQNTLVHSKEESSEGKVYMRSSEHPMLITTTVSMCRGVGRTGMSGALLLSLAAFSCKEK